MGRSPLEWILANGKAPSVLPISEKLLLGVEGLNDARTLLADFFSILLVVVEEGEGLCYDPSCDTELFRAHTP